MEGWSRAEKRRMEGRGMEVKREEKALTRVHGYWQKHHLDYMGLCLKSDVSAFSMLSSSIIAFLPRSKCLLISWL